MSERQTVMSKRAKGSGKGVAPSSGPPRVAALVAETQALMQHTSVEAPPVAAPTPKADGHLGTMAMPLRHPELDQSQRTSSLCQRRTKGQQLKGKIVS